MNKTHLNKLIPGWGNTASQRPDIMRRWRLLLGLLAASAALVAVSVSEPLLIGQSMAKPAVAQLTLLVVSVGVVAIWAVYRYGSPRLAVIASLLVLSTVLAVVNGPKETSRGGDTFFFVVPLLIAGLLLRSWVGLAIAGVSGLLLSTAALDTLAVSSASMIMSLSAVTLGSWLVARRLERQLGESENRFRLVAESMPDGLTIIEQGRAVYVNDRICEITGRSREELATMSTLDFAAPEERERLRQTMEKASRRGTLPGSLVFWVVRPDGTRRCIRNQCVPKCRMGDKMDYYVVTTDITEQRRMEEHLRQAQKMEALGRLAAGVAHDFNNYLTVMDSYTDLLMIDLGPDAPVQRELAEIARAIEQSKSLVRQLLAFSRQQTLRPQVVNVNEVIAEAEGILRRLAGRDIEFVTEYGTDLGLVRADPCQIEQVLLNLVANARDAMAGTGRITVRTANGEMDRAKGKSGEPASYVIIAVSDTGAGMDEETRTHIFEPFFTTKENGAGTGLGLSTVYGVVRQSGGRVEVESEPGRGTTFTVYLPRAAAGG